MILLVEGNIETPLVRFLYPLTFFVKEQRVVVVKRIAVVGLKVSVDGIVGPK